MLKMDDSIAHDGGVQCRKHRPLHFPTCVCVLMASSPQSLRHVASFSRKHVSSATAAVTSPLSAAQRSRHLMRRLMQSSPREQGMQWSSCELRSRNTNVVDSQDSGGETCAIGLDAAAQRWAVECSRVSTSTDGNPRSEVPLDVVLYFVRGVQSPSYADHIARIADVVKQGHATCGESARCRRVLKQVVLGTDVPTSSIDVSFPLADTYSLLHLCRSLRGFGHTEPHPSMWRGVNRRLWIISSAWLRPRVVRDMCGPPTLANDGWDREGSWEVNVVPFLLHDQLPVSQWGDVARWMRCRLDER